MRRADILAKRAWALRVIHFNALNALTTRFNVACVDEPASNQQAKFRVATSVSHISIEFPIVDHLSAFLKMPAAASLILDPQPIYDSMWRRLVAIHTTFMP